MRVGKDMWKMECKLVAVAVETLWRFFKKLKQNYHMIYFWTFMQNK